MGKTQCKSDRNERQGTDGMKELDGWTNAMAKQCSHFIIAWQEKWQSGTYLISDRLYFFGQWPGGHFEAWWPFPPWVSYLLRGPTFFPDRPWNTSESYIWCLVGTRRQILDIPTYFLQSLYLLNDQLKPNFALRLKEELAFQWFNSLYCNPKERLSKRGNIGAGNS